MLKGGGHDMHDEQMESTRFTSNFSRKFATVFARMQLFPVCSCLLDGRHALPDMYVEHGIECWQGFLPIVKAHQPKIMSKNKLSRTEAIRLPWY